MTQLNCQKIVMKNNSSCSPINKWKTSLSALSPILSKKKQSEEDTQSKFDFSKNVSSQIREQIK